MTRRTFSRLALGAGILLLVLWVVLVLLVFPASPMTTSLPG